MPDDSPHIFDLPRRGARLREAPPLSVRSVLRLQQSIGNREVVRQLNERAMAAALLVEEQKAAPAQPWWKRWKAIASRGHA